ncbi:hypothetical protein, partial [uncultured Porphyromonas sp.]|uniref:hypothetical protein n=1 Tax=uncultured Porphyromonas sp. TaxID=159274 RepID=UPI0028041B0E
STDIRFNKKKVNHFQGTTAKRTFREFSKNFPALENKISKGGKINFQGRKRSFPTVESFFSNAGKLQFHGKELVKLP